MNLLEKIIADTASRHQAELEITRDPGFLGCVALLQETADTLTADGFRVWEQVCWSHYGEKPEATITLHVEIHRDHGREGVRRLLDLLPVDQDGYLQRDGATIHIAHHADTRKGWTPAQPAEKELAA